MSKVRVLCILISSLWLTGILVAQSKQSPASRAGTTPRDNEQKQMLELTQQLMKLANGLRATPIAEAGIPTEEVHGQWNMNYLVLTNDVLVVTYVLEPRYKFYVQGIQCRLKEKEAGFLDATILGPEETAATFYSANLKFVDPQNVDFVTCQRAGVEIYTVVRDRIIRTISLGGGQVDVATAKATSPSSVESSVKISESRERVLGHMCNWLAFFAKQDEDARKRKDFLITILDRYEAVFLDTEGKGDLKLLSYKVDLFDTLFPFFVLESNPSLSDEERVKVRQFFQVLVRIRKELRVVAPTSAQNIARDEALMQRLH